jgi:hypothetical protein
MPHPKSKRVGRITPVRLLAILTATLLCVPSIRAEPEDARDQGRTESQDAVSFSQDGGAEATVSLPPPQQNHPNYTDLTCAGSELNAGYVLPTFRNPEADRWGDISIAQPKIWQFERVSALLDGLLRDVEGVSLADLTQLDPSQQNAAALKFIQSALEVGVQYDQAAAVNAANTLSGYNELHASQTQQLQQYNNYMQTLTSERDRLAAQYAASSNEVNALTALKAAGPLTDAQNKQLEEAASKQTTTQASLASVNSLISGVGAAPTLTAPPTVTGTSVQGPASGSSMSSSLSGFSDVLKNLPDGVQKNLSAALQSPSYPATKRLDNFVTLLYERLAREISVLQDDLTRDPENVAFLLQFDVGVYPSKKAKDHVARVEFNLDCPGCKVYSLYPGQSSYNLANYSGASKRTTLWGNALTLLGFGISASYRRQTDTLQGSLVQSVYTSGFQNGVLNEPKGTQIHTGDQIDADRAEQSFGWYYGAAPFEQVVTPGIRTTFAMITVPRSLIRSSQDRFGNSNACIPFHIDAGWSNRNDPLAQNSYTSPVGRFLKQARAPFYIPHRNELKSDSEGDAGDNSNPKCDPKVVCNPNSNPPGLRSPPCCTIRPGTSNASVLMAETSVKLPASLDGYSLIGAREKQQLHVIRMEYDTVYEDTAAVSSTTAVQTTVQTSTQSTNPATGQTTGQTTTQSTGSSVAVSNSTTAPSTSDASATLNPLPCPKLKCAPVLLTLDHPIDPNLTVSVRGNLLERVRDWRGRATSVLPPAQSGTDLSGAAATSGSLSLKQLAQTRGLLEIDQFGPNTWFPLNSHELLLNISIDAATEYEFPVIQLADPSGSVVIPHDLRRSFTELIVNGLRMRPETEHGIQTEVARQNWRDRDPKTGASCLNFEYLGLNEEESRQRRDCVLPLNSKDAPISSGLYPFSTYSPLFSPQPEARRFFATVGETGEDLLIGFLPKTPGEKVQDETPRFDWLGAQTRVVLDDRSQDFAWSLSCDAQGDYLACRIPYDEITRTYLNFLRACPEANACPGIETDYRSLLLSFLNTAQREAAEQLQMHSNLSSPKHEANQSPARAADSGIGVLRLMDTSLKIGPQEKAAPAQGLSEETRKFQASLLLQPDVKGLNNAFLSSMQVWVEQFDAEGKNVFYSPEPMHMGFFPISGDYWRNTHFKPWDFQSATPDKVKLVGCNYLPTGNPKDISVSLLGVPTWKASIGQSQNGTGWTQLTPDGDCGTFEIPTAALANNPIVFQMQFPSSDGKPLRATIAVPRFRVGPSFSQSQMQIVNRIEKVPAEGSKPAIEEKMWEVTIPVAHATCSDNIEISPELLRPQRGPVKVSDYSKIYAEWRSGLVPLVQGLNGTTTDSGHCDLRAWQAAEEAGRIGLYLEIPRAAVIDLPRSIHIIRSTTGDKVTWNVGTLPNLRRLLLPSRATIKPLGPTTFAIVGEHAEVIDHVAVQNMSDATKADVDTITGLDYALVPLPPPSPSGNDSSDSSGNSAGSTNSTNISIVTTKDNADTVKMTQNSSSTPPKASTSATKTPSSDGKTASPKLTAGTYAVVPLVLVGTTPPDTAKLKGDVDQATAALNKAKTGVTQAQAALNAATPQTKGEMQKKLDTAKATLKGSQTALSAAQDKQKTAKPTPDYMPLDVTDENGKPLIFTIPDTKKAGSTTPSTTPASTGTTCVAPCVALPCAASCPQPAGQSVTPKSP